MKSLIAASLFLFCAVVSYAQADLTVTNLTGPSQLIPGVPFQVTADIVNFGTEQSVPTTVHIAAGITASTVEIQNIPALLPFTSHTVTSTWVVPLDQACRGGVGFAWYADYAQLIVELDEFNNHNYFSINTEPCPPSDEDSALGGM